MNSLSKLIKQSKDLAISEAEKYGVPSSFHVNFSYEVGQRLAKELGADPDIVAVGTYLMDCMLGTAYKEARMPDHISMSAKKAGAMLSEYSDISDEVKENIVSCVREHHGFKKFSSLEAEICCNADCYRFSSIRGFIGGIHHGREMQLKDLLNLYKDKSDEKWNALSLDICKKELEPEYKAIQKLISAYKEN